MPCAELKFINEIIIKTGFCVSIQSNFLFHHIFCFLNWFLPGLRYESHVVYLLVSVYHLCHKGIAFWDNVKNVGFTGFYPVKMKITKRICQSCSGYSIFISHINPRPVYASFAGHYSAGNHYVGCAVGDDNSNAPLSTVPPKTLENPVPRASNNNGELLNGSTTLALSLVLIAGLRSNCG